MEFTILKMNKNDLNNISETLENEFDDFWNINILKSELSSTTSSVFVAKNADNEIIGFACIQFILDEATITNIVTKKSYRRNGVGKTLLKYLISYSKKNNIKNITLEVNENNTNAINLYESFGFKQIGLRKQYYNQIDNAIIMILYL